MTPLTGISSMATRQVLADMTSAYERETGAKVAIESVGGVDAAKRVRAGENFDVVILASNVVDQLSIQQQRLVNERRVDSLSGLDLAGLLRVFDQNWNPLGYRLNLDQQARNWLKETQGIRNRWAHLPPGGLRSEDAYRDIDTLYRLLGVLGADQATLDRAQAERGRVLEELAPRPSDK